ncbi:MAG: DUF4292 domain-containing protein [Bacteroidetes bacterium QS_8_68_15]|nr:MAG: DUF4292 domain-containing protein [Bacteroidetes bacterium QS_8_68_15]
MSRPTLSLLLAAVLALTAGVGCSPAPPPAATGELPEAYPNHSFDDIRQALTHGADSLRAFTAEVRLSLDTPEFDRNVSADVRARRGPTGDSLYLSLRKLGIEAARILVTPDSFFVYNALENELTYGALSSAGGMLPAPLRTGKAFENLLGLTAPRAGLDWQVHPRTLGDGKRRYVLTSGDGRRRRRLVVDPSRWRAVRYTERSSSGETLLEERVFSEFGRFAGRFLPRRVELRRPPQNSSASLFYRNLTLNPSSLPPFALDAPDGAERTLVAR